MALIDRERLVCIGRVARAHGLRGGLLAQPLTDAPEYYTRLREILLDRGQGLQPLRVIDWVLHGRRWELRLEGVRDRDGAEALIGAELLIPQEALKPLAEGEYFQHDLLGCQVETRNGDLLGLVTGVLETGANDVLEVAGGGRVIMVPMLAQVVKAVDLAARRICIEPIPGLLEEEE